mgnify:CR=1 FL=1|jgi:hypothetical protein
MCKRYHILCKVVAHLLPVQSILFLSYAGSDCRKSLDPFLLTKRATRHNLLRQTILVEVEAEK